MDIYFITFIFQFLIFSFLYLFLQTAKAKELLNSKKIYIRFVIAILILQIISAAMLRQEVGDVMLFSSAGWYLRQKIDFYFIDQGHMQYPFFPLLIFFHAFANLLTEKISLFTFSFYLKLPLLISLQYLAYIIFNHHQKKSVLQARLLQLQFLTHPITYAVVIFHGQVDVILLALFFASAKILLSSPQNYKTFLLSALFYASSIAAKTWSVLFLPVILKYQKNLIKTLVFGIITAVFLLTDVFVYTRIVFGSSIRTVLPAVLKPGGSIGVWGISYLFSPFKSIMNFITANSLLIFASFFLISQGLILPKKLSFWQTCFLTVMAIYLIIPRWGVQYLFWILPFMFITKSFIDRKNFRYFSLLSSVYVFLNYINIAFGQQFIQWSLINWLGLLLWFFILYWFIELIKNNESCFNYLQ